MAQRNPADVARIAELEVAHADSERSFGTESAAGSLFVERMLTVTTNLRQQNRDALHYVAPPAKRASSAARRLRYCPRELRGVNGSCG